MESGKIDRRRRYTLSVIREAFFSLLAEVGFAKMTVADICRRADINRGTFYLHYEDKFALLDALIDEALAAAPPLEGTEAGTIIFSTRMTTRTPGWRSASLSAAPSRWFPRLWRRPGSRARMPIYSSSTTSREISRSTACSAGSEGLSSPMHRSCSAPIPKEACRRFRVATIPVAHLEREPVPGRRLSYAFAGRSGNLSAERYSAPVTGIATPAFEFQHVQRTVQVRDLRLHAGLPLL